MTVPHPTVTGWRSTVLFLTGLGLTVHEAVIRAGPERPSLLVVYVGMMGLPAFLHADTKRADDSRAPQRELP